MACYCPPLYSKGMVALVMFLYFLAACITAGVLVARNYPDKGTDNWVLMGGLMANQVSFRVRQHGDLDRLVVSTDKEFQNVVYQQELPSSLPSSSQEEEEENGSSILVHSVTATNLQANSQYYYATIRRSNHELWAHRGSFTTAPELGTRSPFQFVASGCSWTGSTHDIYTTIFKEEADALFFLHMGDLHYEDLNVDSVNRRLQAIDRVMNSDKQRQLFSHRPMVYMWDDHDWLGNNAGGDPDEIGREAALESYRIAMPYYSPLPSSSQNNSSSMYHAFTIGTVRFVVSDLRSEAITDNNNNNNSTMYSKAQREWLYNEFSQSDQYDFLIWVSTKPWIGEADPTSDAWWGFSEDRAELSNWLRDNLPKNNLLAIASDAHMIALDDGSNTFYGSTNSKSNSSNSNDDGTNSTKSFPILQTGPLDRLASFKGGPFTEGCTAYKYERNHQYSVVEFLNDDNGEYCLEIRTFRIEGPYSKKQAIFTKRFCGNDIFAKANPGAGSCEVAYFSKTNVALISTSAALLVIAMGLTGGVVGGRRAAILTSLMIFVLFAATYIAGFMIPVSQDVDQFNAFETALICLLQLGTVVIHLLAWRFLGTPKTGKKQDDDQDEEEDNNQEEPNDEEGKEEEEEEPKASKTQDAQVY